MDTAEILLFCIGQNCLQESKNITSLSVLSKVFLHIYSTFLAPRSNLFLCCQRDCCEEPWRYLEMDAQPNNGKKLDIYDFEFDESMC